MQAAPLAPHADGAVPDTQRPLTSQHPVWQVAGEQRLPPPHEAELRRNDRPTDTENQKTLERIELFT